MNAESQAMLAPYRVLDLTNEWGFLCGRLLADLGADVVKVEKPGGDPARNIGPFYHDIPHPEKSLYWFSYNANKRGITLNIETADGREIFKKLVKAADFVIESFQPGYMDEIGLGYSALSEVNPRLIMTSITPFGQTGPYSKYRASDIVSTALCGWLYKCGDPDRPPLRISPPQAPLHGAAQAVTGTLMAHYYRETTGEGQHVDAMPLPWMTYFSQAAIRWCVAHINERRHGPYWEWAGRPLTRYVWECKDGYVCFGMMGGGRAEITLQALVEWMDSEGTAPDFLKSINWSKLDFGSIDQKFRDRIEEPVVKFFKQHTKAEMFREAVRRDIMLLPAYNAKELLADPQFASRGYWVNVEHPELETTITYPGAFFRSSETSWKMKRRAPLIGEHNEEIYIKELGFSKENFIMLKQSDVI